MSTIKNINKIISLSPSRSAEPLPFSFKSNHSRSCGREGALTFLGHSSLVELNHSNDCEFDVVGGVIFMPERIKSNGREGVLLFRIFQRDIASSRSPHPTFSTNTHFTQAFFKKRVFKKRVTNFYKRWLEQAAAQRC